MKQLIIIGTLLFTALLFVFSIYLSGSIFMLFAATSIPVQIIRGFMMALLIVLLLSHPPRLMALRVILGGFAVLLVGVSLSLIFSASMHFLDAIVFFLVAIIFGLEALEEDTMYLTIAYSAHRGNGRSLRSAH